MRDVPQERDPSLLFAVTREVERERWLGGIEECVTEPGAVLAWFDEPDSRTRGEPGARAKTTVVEHRVAILAEDLTAIDRSPRGERVAGRLTMTSHRLLATEIAAANSMPRIAETN
jgi:hypothetical protein